MKFHKPHTPTPEPRSSNSPAVSCPLLGIARVDHHGMVLEMRHGLEVGSAIALGFHLQGINAAPLGDQATLNQGQSMEASPPQPVGSYFIGVEAIVIESKLGSSALGQPAHVVTVLFSQISRADKKRLMYYCRNHRDHLRRSFLPPMPHKTTPGDFTEKLHRQALQHIHLN